MSTTTPRYYDALGLDPTATPEEIARAYRKVAHQNHPDKTVDMDPEEREIAEGIFKNASRAYQVLTNKDKRAEYDLQLAAEQERPRSSGPTDDAPRGTRRFHDDSRSGYNRPTIDPFDVDLAKMSWFTPKLEGADATYRAPVWARYRTFALVVVWLAWIWPMIVAFGVSQHAVLHSGGLYLLIGPVVHVLIAGALGLLLRSVARDRFPVVPIILIALPVLATEGIVEYAAAAGNETFTGASLWFARLAPAVATAGSIALAYFAIWRPWKSWRGASSHKLVDSTPFVSVGSTSVGSRHGNIERLISLLQEAFDGRRGVRVILLPDRVTVPPSAAVGVRTQAIIIIGRDVHLLAIPRIGEGGMEVSGNTITTPDGSARNVVLDEMQEIRRNVRGARVHGYVAMTTMTSRLADPVEAGGVLIGHLDQLLDRIGTVSEKSLDAPSADVYRGTFDASARLV